MYRQEAKAEYARALRLGQKEMKDALLAGKPAHPVVLDEMLPGSSLDKYQELGLLEIPVAQIVGTKTAGRIGAFSPGFWPLLSAESEFATKWVDLCCYHMSDEGIRDPIVCYEYLGEFYIQEGNKRLSVLKHFGASYINAIVRRVLPVKSDDPRIVAYYEFLDFYRDTGMYTVQLRKPGDYGRFLAAVGKQPGEKWDYWEKRALKSNIYYFSEAFRSLGGDKLSVRPEEAMLLWLKIHKYEELGALSSHQLKKTMAALWPDLLAACDAEGVVVRTEPIADNKSSTWSKLLNRAPERLKVAFVHQYPADSSDWTLAHEEGRRHLQRIFSGSVTTVSYYGADTTARAIEIIEQAVAEGAKVIFTTSPQLSFSTLKVAVKYPKLRFFNCSVDLPLSSVHTYYGRIFEGKFITGAIAGAMAVNDRIGYIGSAPIFGEMASINAFALGAMLTNPRATIDLRWSCMEGNPVEDLIADGVRVISNRDVPSAGNQELSLCNYGTYLVDDDGSLRSLAAPFWDWGCFYEKVVGSILEGTWDDVKGKAVNDWWGMKSGVIDVKLAKDLPAGVSSLAQMLRTGLRHGLIDPFCRPITAQDGTLKNDGSRTLSATELLHMDWLCDSVDGFIPTFDQIAPYAQSMVRTLGIYRDQIPPVKEVL
jgi:basic membrane lipoprotein Med (substrate-binding protein (PBP1-ABC) superfamily)